MFRKFTREKLDVFLSSHATQEKVLDVGSGGSSYGRFFPNRLTFDIDPRRKPDLVGDAHHLPFENNQFAVVLATEVLEHCIDPLQVVDELFRVTRVGGKCILTTRFVYPLHDAPNDFWRFTSYNLQRIFERSGFVNVSIISELDNFSAIGALLQRICFQSDLRGGKFTKLGLFVLAEIFNNLNFLIKKEYGDIKKSQVAKNIMSTGWYVTAEKP